MKKRKRRRSDKKKMKGDRGGEEETGGWSHTQRKDPEGRLSGHQKALKGE